MERYAAPRRNRPRYWRHRCAVGRCRGQGAKGMDGGMVGGYCFDGVDGDFCVFRKIMDSFGGLPSGKLT